MDMDAKEWVKRHKDELIEKFADLMVFLPEELPVTTFMAGTPGAGKTEFSIKLLESFSTPVVRIDADEIRALLPGYTGENASMYQEAVDKAVNILYDHTRKNNQSVLIDGTFAYGNWRENIKRSLKRGRKVEIYYLYQHPVSAWEFCKKRANKPGGRVVPRDVFIRSYFKSIKNVDDAIKEFPQINVYFAENDYKSDLKDLKIGVKSITATLPTIFTKDELESIIT